MADDPDDGHAEGRLETGKVDLAAPGGELVQHREHDTDGLLEPQGLADEGQGACERAGIHDQNQGVRPGDAFDSSSEHVFDDGLVGADRRETVGAGEVDQGRFALAQRKRRLAPLDRHPGIIADAGPQAGERVEEGRLAGIRAAEQAEDGRRVRVPAA